MVGGGSVIQKGVATVDTVRVLQQYYLRLRQDPRFRSTVLVTQVESNISEITAKDINDGLYAPELQPTMAQCDVDPHGDTRPGIWLSDKERMIQLTVKLLRSNQIRFAESFLAVEPSVRPEAVKSELSRQLKAYTKKKKETHDEIFTQPRFVHSGKSRDGAVPDDLATVFISGPYNSAVFLCNLPVGQGNRVVANLGMHPQLARGLKFGDPSVQGSVRLAMRPINPVY